MPSQETHMQLNEYVNKYIEVRKRTEEKKKELHGLQMRRDALLDLLVYLKGQKAPTYSELDGDSLFPLSLGKSHSKFTVVSIGILPPEESFSFFNSNYIYPPGYKSKRKFGDEKSLFYCQIRNIHGECVFEIRGPSEKIWKGEKDYIWREFSLEYEKNPYSSIEAFFGLTHEVVQKIIEEMGDISMFSSYIPLRVRQRKGRRTKKEEEP
ncbi:hypothetical protein NEFER03_0875 [Nematocida sp. LUAm3]|nr:hypothetical protein NEFER03_0875 [Nematocida sp. LUAm3]KAI5174893.1 hypothetical protein NEFER02_0993 [Nematocida sp. LUAm2]KAI5177509.1 hypothetical protein NEFER01_0759 [Nematocida sp. LUAm1]